MVIDDLVSHDGSLSLSLFPLHRFLFLLSPSVSVKGQKSVSVNLDRLDFRFPCLFVTMGTEGNYRKVHFTVFIASKIELTEVNHQFRSV